MQEQLRHLTQIGWQKFRRTKRNISQIGLLCLCFLFLHWISFSRSLLTDAWVISVDSWSDLFAQTLAMAEKISVWLLFLMSLLILLLKYYSERSFLTLLNVLGYQKWHITFWLGLELGLCLVVSYLISLPLTFGGELLFLYVLQRNKLLPVAHISGSILCQPLILGLSLLIIAYCLSIIFILGRLCLQK